MRQRTSQTLFAYWNEVRGRRLAPRRFEIEPARISTILPETFILERQDYATFTFRLAGTRICDQLARELRNTNLLDLVPPADRLTVEDRLGATAHGAVALFEFETKVGKHGGRCEAIVLPLTDNQDVVARYLGAMSPMEASAWDAEPMTLGTLIRSELIWPEGRPYPFIERSRAQPPFRPLLPVGRIVRAEAREFRVYDGGRTDPPGSGR